MNGARGAIRPLVRQPSLGSLPRPACVVAAAALQRLIVGFATDAPRMAFDRSWCPPEYSWLSSAVSQRQAAPTSNTALALMVFPNDQLSHNWHLFPCLQCPRQDTVSANLKNRGASWTAPVAATASSRVIVPSPDRINALAADAGLERGPTRHMTQMGYAIDRQRDKGVLHRTLADLSTESDNDSIGCCLGHVFHEIVRV